MHSWKIAASPEEAGLSSQALLDYLSAIDRSGMEHHSIMVVKNGMLAADMHFAPYTAKTPHICYSMSKPFLSIAAGFAVSEGLLSWDSRVIDVLSDKAPADPDPWLASVTLHHLLSMSSGLCQCSDNHEHLFHPEINRGEDWATAVLACGCDAPPGTVFRYNSHGSYLIACMVQKAAGMNLVDYLMPRLFEPLEIARPRWDMSPQGVCCGGWGLYLSCESFAKLGVCLLDRGMWGGKQILPPQWLHLATQKHIATDNVPRKPEWAQGYGYHLWHCTEGRFRGDGTDGQFLVVSPKQNMIIAATAHTEQLVEELDLINEYLFNEARQAPADESAQSALRARIRSLRLDNA